MIEYRDPGRYIPIIFRSCINFWGSLFEVPSKVPLNPAGAAGKSPPTNPEHK